MKQTESEKFRDLLQTFDTAVLVTHTDNGCLRARPMVVADVDNKCDIWFITDEDSAKVHEIAEDTRVHIVAQKGRDSCVSLSGRAFLVRDRERIRGLWKTAFRVWFPQGAEDPSIALIRVAGDEAEYWDNTGAKRF